MRIAFVLNSLGTGGAEIHTLTLASELQARGHECLLLPLLPTEQIDRRGLDLVCIHGNRLTDRAAIRRMGEVLEQFAADVIVAVNGRPASYAQLASLIGPARRRPVVAIYHTTKLLDLRQKLQYLSNLLFMNRSDALVFVSENQRAYCSRQGMTARRIETIHNGIDALRMNPDVRAQHRQAMRAQLGLTENDYVVGLSAAFRPEKNHRQAIAALAALRAQGIPARLLLLGDGPTRPEIARAAQDQGLGDAVIFAGRQSDVIPWLSTFDVGLLTSTAVETFSLAALEFMALGVPGVLSDIGGANEMVADGRNGHVFPVGDTPALIAALADLADPDRRAAMGEAAAGMIAASFTLATMISRYEQLLSTVR